MADLEPPAHVTGAAADVWRSVTSSHPKPDTLDPLRLEAYVFAVDHLRRSHEDIAANGVTVTDDRGQSVKNPALAAAKDAQEQVRRWGLEFSRPHAPKRRRGTMYDATVTSIASSEHLAGEKRFAGACEAVKTLAWLIDESQRAGIDALQKAAFGAIPAYLKACAELQITPAALPEGAQHPRRRGEGKLQALRGGLASGAAAGQ